MEIKTRAELDIEGMKTSVDNMTPKEYCDYCKKLWVSVDDVIKELEKHGSCFTNGRCKLGHFEQCISNIYTQLTDSNNPNVELILQNNKK